MVGKESDYNTTTPHLLPPSFCLSPLIKCPQQTTKRKLMKSQWSHKHTLFFFLSKKKTPYYHIGVAIAGLTADGRVLSRYMRSECINYGYTYESPLPVGRLVVQLADKAQVCTQRSWKRPYGVGLLVAGLDESGAHLYYNCPSGNYFEYQAFAIGSRSQAAKTCLVRKFENFTSSSRDDLIKDALFAIRETLQGEKLTSSVCTVSVVGLGESFTILDQATVQALINELEVAGEEAPAHESAAEPAGGDAGGAAAEEAAPLDI